MTDDIPRAVATQGDQRLKVTGTAAVASGAVMIAALMAPRLGPLNAVMVILAVIVSPAAIWGLLVAGLGRSSLLAQRLSNAWFSALLVLLGSVAIGELLRVFPGNLEGLMIYLALAAALVMVVAGPLAGMICIVRREVTGWRRWVPLGLAVALALAVLPAISQQPVSPMFVLFLPIALLLTGGALLSYYPEPVDDPDEK